ncbi:hypothetical protein FKW77_003883 [Venturia effusa]|uniref:C3H1-type domain-containing protein n=1 Tax=Venturia effusa TaxID=50376 RepID=A0A517LNR1_9PEZI|nr:hypothetical protein FKW77_003883 [Venturia effusa]
MSPATSPSTNGAIRATENDPVVEAWSRYERLKAIENEKDSFIKEILWRYEFVVNQNNDYALKLAEAKHLATPSSARELQKQVLLLHKALDRDPFVLVLVDADGMVFHDDLVSDGAHGGKKAAKMLEESVKIYVHEIVPDLPDSTKVVARFYANVEGLAETCCKAGIVTSPQIKKEFVKGFTQGRTLFDFVDVGSGKDRADEKVIETFKLHAHDYRCRHIILGCSHDNGFVRLLENYVFDDLVFPRVTLLEGVPFEKEFDSLQFSRQRFGTLFRNQKIALPSTLPPWAVLGSDFIPARNGNMTPSDSVASLDNTGNVPLTTWASKAKAAAAMPVTPPSAKLNLASSSPAGIPRNRKGQRVDPTCNFDKTEVDRVRKLKMCNVHYLRQECPYGDTCTHQHDRIPTKTELEALRVVARMAACRNGSTCEDIKCIYGHRCQAPPRLDKTKWTSSEGGKTCIFGSDCVFPGELHNIDTNIVKTVVPGFQGPYGMAVLASVLRTQQLIVWMERHSLDTLAAISKYEPLASAVREIVVATHYFPCSEEEDFEEAYFRPGTDAFTRRDLVTDQTTLLHGGFATAVLSNSFPRFPNLKHLGFGEAYTVVKPPSYARVDWAIVRKHYLSNSMVRFYTKHKLYPTRGLDWHPELHDEIQFVITSMWLVVLTAISQAGLQLESFRVKRCLGINIDSFSSCTTALCHSLQASCGSTLRTLHLVFLGPVDREQTELMPWIYCFPTFLANFPNLEELMLQSRAIFGFDLCMLSEAIHHLPVFTRLRRLTLTELYVNYAHLLEYLGKHKTLDKLALHWVVFQTADPSQSAWSCFLAALPKILDLQRLEITDPIQMRGLWRVGDMDENIDFTVSDWQKDAREMILEQPDFAAKLQRAVESITITDRHDWSGPKRIYWPDDDPAQASGGEQDASNGISWTESPETGDNEEG